MKNVIRLVRRWEYSDGRWESREKKRNSNYLNYIRHGKIRAYQQQNLCD